MEGQSKMHNELYTDGVSEITITGSVVRVDLVSLSPTERDAKDNPKKVFQQRLIFSTDGFANSVELMQRALQGLAEAGVVKRLQPKAPGGKEESASNERVVSLSSDATRVPNASTNFR
jgi:hypothetical protein